MSDKIKNSGNVISLTAWREAAAKKAVAKGGLKSGADSKPAMSQEEEKAHRELERHRYYRDYLDEYGHESIIANIEAIYGPFEARPVHPNADGGGTLPNGMLDVKGIAKSLAEIYLYYSKTHGPEAAEFAAKQSCKTQGGGDLISDVLDNLPTVPPHKPECC